MGVTGGCLIQREELLQLPKWEVPFYILLLIHHTAAEGFFVGLSLEYLLLYGPCLQESQRWSTVGTQKEAPLESVTNQTAVSCQDHLVPRQTSTDNRQVLPAAVQPYPIWLLI